MLESCLPKFLCISPKPQNLRMWLSFGDNVFAEAVKLEWAHTQVGPNPTNITGIFYKNRNVDTGTEEDNVKTQAEDSHPEIKEKGLE